MKLSRIFAVCLVTITTFSCSKPEYVSDQVKSWIQCNKGVSELSFQDDNGNRQILKVTYKSYLPPSGSFSERIETIDVIFSNSKSDVALTIGANAELSNALNFSFDRAFELNHTIYIDALGEIERYNGLAGTMDILPELDLNGSIYENVYRYSFTEEIYNVIILHEFLYSKKSGLLRYSLNGDLWTRVL